MLGATKKKLIIVVDDKTAPYGELMAALIAMKDDKDGDDGEKIIYGVEDGTVETVIWTDKIYADNQAQLGSNNKVLFIGSFDSAKAVQSNIFAANPFSTYGISYGSLGNRAVIYVDKKALTKDKGNYDSFFDSYCEFLAGTDTDYARSQNPTKNEFAMDRVNKTTGVASDAVSNGMNKGISAVNNGINKDNGAELATVENNEVVEAAAPKKKFALPQVSKKFMNRAATALATALSGGAIIGIAKAQSDKEVQDQQYRCAVFAYYIEQLAQFME